MREDDAAGPWAGFAGIQFSEAPAGASMMLCASRLSSAAWARAWPAVSPDPDRAHPVALPCVLRVQHGDPAAGAATRDAVRGAEVVAGPGRTRRQLEPALRVQVLGPRHVGADDVAADEPRDRERRRGEERGDREGDGERQPGRRRKSGVRVVVTSLGRRAAP